ncbi:MAG TPA: alpha/beta hydrolase [Pyrinomonadaceae bacterium]
MEAYDAIRRDNRRHFLRRMMLTLALLLVVGVPLLFYAVRRFERAATFYPVAFDGGPTWRLPRGAEDVWIKTRSGVRLHGWLVRTQRDAPAATVVYFHGNGGNLSYVGWLAEELAGRGFDVLVFDYKGYGRSEGATTDERSLYEDADAVYDYLTVERERAPERLILYGQSLGTAAVVDLASRRPCGALILESGLSSASDVAALLMPWAPRFLHRMGRNRLDTARKLARVERPVLVAHGEADDIIPVEQGRALYEAAKEPKRLLIIPRAGHNNLVAAGGHAYLDGLAEFIRASVGESDGAPAP